MINLPKKPSRVKQIKGEVTATSEKRPPKKKRLKLVSSSKDVKRWIEMSAWEEAENAYFFSGAERWGLWHLDESLGVLMVYNNQPHAEDPSRQTLEMDQVESRLKEIGIGWLAKAVYGHRDVSDEGRCTQILLLTCDDFYYDKVREIIEDVGIVSALEHNRSTELCNTPVDDPSDYEDPLDVHLPDNEDQLEDPLR